MEKLGQLLMNVGETMQNLGFFIMPFSFVAYLIMTFLQYSWRKIHYTKGVKVFWYIAVALGESTNDKRIASVVIMMIYMDAIDSLFEFLEERRELKITKK
ncbi:hypothetical protein JZO72_08155 [Vagococcus fluvialis]|uniref:hypothetical protein n=1 Tax=Vagococcus TaxID=2737 RepID=UPI001A8CAADA|nr:MULTISPECIES: hypothetical protein [Vagococcus]MBO0479601.1 hypothetical protein [Vagococcus fluvialis]MBO0485355.1 hypothetical protein [Vagococcus fluvialis]MDT2829750.1 hypothetical protein [Vagococcus carniphilus]MDT2839209.1 hypothetical protein [Vagococcus carniphilus]MDT2853267.1 hypothetical protein [Vagococcus carniphilus]